jgi:hypothetical protein
VEVEVVLRREKSKVSFTLIRSEHERLCTEKWAVLACGLSGSGTGTGSHTESVEFRFDDEAILVWA